MELAGDRRELTLSGSQPALNGGRWEVNGRKEREKLRRRRRRWGARYIPPGPKVTVLTSPYSPPVSSFFPLNRKSTPPAFPALTMISFRPRMVRSLPAARSSDGDSFAVGGDRDPGFFAGLDDDRKLARKLRGELGDVLGATARAGLADCEPSCGLRGTRVGAVPAGIWERTGPPASPGLLRRLPLVRALWSWLESVG
jgi:hypothetical protein